MLPHLRVIPVVTRNLLGTRSVVLVAGLSACATHLPAQVDTSRSTARVITSGSRVVLFTPSGRWEGKALRVADGKLIVATSNGLDSVPVESVERWQRRGSSPARVAPIGALLGGAASVAAVVTDARCSANCDQDDAFAPIALVAGAALGAVVGAVVGLFIPQWRDESGQIVVREVRPPSSSPFAWVAGGAPHQGSMWDAGIGMAHGNFRFGVEMAALGTQGSWNTSERSRRLRGVLVERRVAEDLWVLGSVNHAEVKEARGSPSATVRTTRSLGGGAGILLRSQRIGPLRVQGKGRWELGMGSWPMWTVGIEL